jgi:hypothetical protein
MPVTLFSKPRYWRHQFALAAIFGLTASVSESRTAVAQAKLESAPAAWTVSGKFKKDEEARINISGAACAAKAPPFDSCIVVNDQKKYAQFFSIDGTVINPGKVIRLLDKDAKGDPDAEGAAYDNGNFYITGSHGRSRHDPDDHNKSSYVVFRFPVDKTTGKPAFHVSDDDVVGVEASRRLRDVIKDKVGAFFDRPLDENGVNIEGIAVKDGRMYLGLRGPSDNGNAIIISVDADAVFAPDQDLNARAEKLHLGPATGIRDLATVSDGLLVLTGPVNKQEVTPSVRHWNPKTAALGQPRALKIPDLGTDAKAETLLVLRDVDGEPWRVLVMFDGPENGAPTEYRIPR